VAGALLASLMLTIMVRTQPKAFILTLIAFLCIVGTQVVFWTFTYPANQETGNWTMLAANWRQLREQWEYSHAASAVLNIIALITLILSVLVSDEYLFSERLTSWSQYARVLNAASPPARADALNSAPLISYPVRRPSAPRPRRQERGAWFTKQVARIVSPGRRRLQACARRYHSQPS
jgi:hypothetical protein